MPVSDTELALMFEHVLSHSRVDETQSVAVLKSHYSNQRTFRYVGIQEVDNEQGWLLPETDPFAQTPA